MKIGKHQLELSDEGGIEASFHRPTIRSPTMNFNADSPTSPHPQEDDGGSQPQNATRSTLSPRYSKTRSVILIGIGICVFAAVGVGLVMQQKKKRSTSLVSAASATSVADSDIPLCSELDLTVPPTFEPFSSPSKAPFIPGALGDIDVEAQEVDQGNEESVDEGDREHDQVAGILSQVQAPSSPPTVGHSISDRNDGIWLDDTWAGDDEFRRRELRGRKVQVVTELGPGKVRTTQYFCIPLV